MDTSHENVSDISVVRLLQNQSNNLFPTPQSPYQLDEKFDSVYIVLF